MRLTPLEIAFCLIAALTLLACCVTLVASRAEHARHAASRAAFSRIMATTPQQPARPEDPEEAIIAAAWGFARRPCGCVVFFGGQPPIPCSAHAVDAEIATWGI